MSDINEMKAKAQVNSMFGTEAQNALYSAGGGYADTDSAYPADAAMQIVENSAAEAIIAGDIASNFDILAMYGEFSNREAYAVTRPDDDDNTISIGKAAKNAVIDIDRWIVYRFDKQGQPAVGIVIFDKAGKKYATSSAYFIREFLTLNMICVRDKEKLEKIKVIYKQSKNGQTYPMCTFA